MHQMPLIKTLIEQLGQQAKTSADHALHKLLTIHADQLPAINDYFHKAFRQGDVTDDGKVDMEIWELIHESHAFWEVFNKMPESKLPAP